MLRCRALNIADLYKLCDAYERVNMLCSGTSYDEVYIRLKTVSLVTNLWSELGLKGEGLIKWKKLRLYSVAQRRRLSKRADRQAVIACRSSLFG